MFWFWSQFVMKSLQVFLSHQVKLAFLQSLTPLVSLETTLQYLHKLLTFIAFILAYACHVFQSREQTFSVKEQKWTQQFMGNLGRKKHSQLRHDSNFQVSSEGFNYCHWQMYCISPSPSASCAKGEVLVKPDLSQIFDRNSSIQCNWS